MSTSIRYEFKLKGKNEDLADFVSKHMDEDFFYPETLGVEYPEEMDVEKYYHPQDIIDYGLNEIGILFNIVYRRHFENPSVEEDIYDAIVDKYPNLEVEYFVNDPYLPF